MNFIETVGLVLIIIMVVFTFISEPALSLRYYKEFFKSGKVVVMKIVGFVKGFKTDNEVVINETEDN